MSRDNKKDTTIYKGVINHEEQYSIWPVNRTIPTMLKDANKKGTRKECLEYIEEVWTDATGLQREFAKAQHAQFQRQFDEFFLVPTHAMALLYHVRGAAKYDIGGSICFAL